jgi:hypothetical protein
VDERAVAAAVDETAALLRGDGADLVLVRADATVGRIELTLDLSAVECLDCVVPPELLEQMVTAELQRKVRGEFELVLHDPRRT